jgi:uncharacterized protein (TIGR00299 family) protein
MIAYLDLPSGLSGDMMLGCLLDAGWPLEALQETLERLSLPPGSWSVQPQPVMRGPLRATLAVVEVAEVAPRRSLNDIRQIVEHADLPQPVKERALGVFLRLAEAEASVHGIPIDEVHFHEVGALDAIVDVVGAAAGLIALDIEQLYASPVPMGHGWVETQHGLLPVPAPATLALLASVHAPLQPAPGPGELVTPTGAAMLAAWATFTQPSMRLLRVATGAGQRQLDWPNVARLWLGEPSVDGSLVLLQTNIDDMNPQLYGDVTRHLLEAGALDVWLAPVQMKKGRPGVLLSVLASLHLEARLAGLMLRETTTLGVRVLPVRRWEAGRQIQEVETGFGVVRVKLKELDGQVVAAVPEYEDCVRLAEAAGVPTRQVYEAAQAAAYRRFLA